jgi:hypothetical protein
MNTPTYPASAKIYHFPLRSRRTPADHREGAGAIIERVSQRICEAAMGDCWYHEAAINQGESQSRKM